MSKAYIAIIILLTAVIIFQIWTTGGETFVCPDGTTAKSVMECPLQQSPQVSARDAENAARQYGNAQANARGYQFTLVNRYREDADYFAQTLFTNRQTEHVEEVILKIDGRTAVVSCFENCNFLERQTNQTQDI